MEDLHKTAKNVTARHTTHGLDKENAKKSGKISSVGTERIVRQCFYNYLQWCERNEIHPDFRGSAINSILYLEEQSKRVKQKTLDQKRQALQHIFHQKLPNITSSEASVYCKRSYDFDEVNSILLRQHPKNRITTLLSFHSGIRAHEAATILPINERSISTHREWDSRRFKGFPEHKIYSVIGKGGLIREIAVPLWLAFELEENRIQTITVKDREINYSLNYDIGFGQAWSESFSSASKRALGLSRGAHGLRHSYCKARLEILMNELKANKDQIKCSNLKEDALLILSQELGHFRMDIVFYYLK
jgi:integrase